MKRTYLLPSACLLASLFSRPAAAQVAGMLAPNPGNSNEFVETLRSISALSWWFGSYLSGFLQLVFLYFFNFWSFASSHFIPPVLGVDSILPYEPDERFDHLEELVETTPPFLESDWLIDSTGLETGRELIVELSRSFNGVRALRTTLNRLHTAIARGELDAVELQRQHIETRVLPHTLEATRRCRSLLEKLQPFVREYELSPSQVATYLEDHRRHGPPILEVEASGMFGMTRCELAEGERYLFETPAPSSSRSLRTDVMPKFGELLDDLLDVLPSVPLNPPASSLVAAEGCTLFRRGEVDEDVGLNLSDPIRLASWLFLDGEPASCERAADVNGDDVLDVSDTVYLLNFLFLGGAEPVSPGPYRCGLEVRPSPLTCEGGGYCE